MSNGGYKGASPARETSPEQYPGVWELTEQFQAQADGNWPFQADDNAPKSLRFDSYSPSGYLTRTQLLPATNAPGRGQGGSSVVFPMVTGGLYLQQSIPITPTK